MTLYVHRRKAVPDADVTIYKAKECVTGESSKYLNRKQREEALSSLALAAERLTQMTSSVTHLYLHDLEDRNCQHIGRLRGREA